MSLPMSLRTPETETRYQAHRIVGKLVPLDAVEPTASWEHWKLIPNAYPYDGAFSRHDMLLPLRVFGQREEMNVRELVELHQIMQGLASVYDCFIENTLSKQSQPGHFHIHCAVYHAERMAA